MHYWYSEISFYYIEMIDNKPGALSQLNYFHKMQSYSISLCVLSLKKRKKEKAEKKTYCSLFYLTVIKNLLNRAWLTSQRWIIKAVINQIFLTQHTSNQWLKTPEHFIIFAIEFSRVKMMSIVPIKL